MSVPSRWVGAAGTSSVWGMDAVLFLLVLDQVVVGNASNGHCQPKHIQRRQFVLGHRHNRHHNGANLLHNPGNR